MRKLASIQEIESLEPIEGKDKIVLAKMRGLGWQVIVQKEQVHVGDKVVYCETDSVMPQTPDFCFLAKVNYRIKIMKMAGVRSEGIIFPLTVLPERKKPYEVGEDVTKVLGVTEYEPDDPVPEESLTKKKRRYPKWLMRYAWFRKLVLRKKVDPSFPNEISRTDEDRIQTCPERVNKVSPAVYTEKVDGMSSTAMLRQKKKGPFTKYEFLVCSHNRRLTSEDDMPQIWAVVKKYNMEKVLKDLILDDNWVAIQFETIAPKVQGNPYKVTEPDGYVFNVITQYGGRMNSMVAKTLVEYHGLQFVPIVDKGIDMSGMSVDEVLEIATGPSMINPDVMREGLVIRNMDNGKISFKAVSPEYLLRKEKKEKK